MAEPEDLQPSTASKVEYAPSMRSLVAITGVFLFFSFCAVAIDMFFQWIDRSLTEHLSNTSLREGLRFIFTFLQILSIMLVAFISEWWLHKFLNGQSMNPHLESGVEICMAIILFGLQTDLMHRLEKMRNYFPEIPLLR
jgi:hypothetical protein